MKKEQLLQSVKENVRLNELDDALEKLNMAVGDSSELQNMVITIEAEYLDLKKSQVMGLMSGDEARRNANQVRERILKLTDLAAKGNDPVIISHHSLRHVEISFRIRVIAHDQGALKYMKMNFFDPLGYVLRPEDYCIARDFDSVEGYDLIVFDNRFLGPVRTWSDRGELDESQQLYLEEISECMENIPIHFIHLGEELYLLNRYRAKAHAANSLFALHARIREMLQFVKDYRI
ncbi:MAG: hypothetical protein R3D00_19875 [Bacteroidia bacterium]